MLIDKDFDHLFESGSAGCTCVFTTDFCLDFKRFLCSNDLSFWKVQGSGKPYFSHDWLIYFYAREFSQKVCIDPNAHLLYRIHSANVHGTLNLKTLKEIIILFRVNLVQEVIIQINIETMR